MNRYLLSTLILICHLSIIAQGFIKTISRDVEMVLTHQKMTPSGSFILSGHSGLGTGPWLHAVQYNSEIIFRNAYFRPDTQLLLGNALVLTPGGKIFMGGTAAKDTGSNEINRAFLLSADAMGNMIEENLVPNDSNNSLNDLALSRDGYLYGAGHHGFITPVVTDPHQSMVYKWDTGGNLLWKRKFYGSGNQLGIIRVIQGPGADMFLLAQERVSGTQQTAVYRINSSGAIVWENHFGSASNTWAFDFVYNGDALYMCGHKGLTGVKDAWVAKMNVSGTLQWEKSWSSDFRSTGPTAPVLESIFSTPDGKLMVYENRSGGGTDMAIPTLRKLDTSGVSIRWSDVKAPAFRHYDGHAIGLPDGGVCISEFNSHPIFGWTSRLIKCDSLGRIRSNTLKGFIYEDTAILCQRDTLIDKGVDPILLLFTNNKGDSIYTYTFRDGYYEVNLDSGWHKKHIFYWSPLTERRSCAVPDSFYFPGYFIDSTYDFPAQNLSPCPQMELTMGANSQKLCDTTEYIIQYCNRGRMDAVGAYLILDIDSLFKVDSAEIAYMMVGGSYRFNLGTVNAGDCNMFKLYGRVTCNIHDFMRTSRFSGYLYPDVVCVPGSASWDGSSVTVRGYCESGIDSVRFIAYNEGAGNMSVSRSINFYKDSFLAYTMPILLSAGDSVSIRFALDSSTYLAYMSQTPGHPYRTYTSDFVEACGLDTMFSHPGFAFLIPFDDEAAYKEIDCRQVEAPYDPNIKESSLMGYGPQHIIRAGDKLEYTIHFQNTGTDTAFNIFILDTISSNLQLSTLRAGLSSHKYEVKMLGSRCVGFYFPNINLVDSFTSEPLSKGWITYTISQIPSYLKDL